VLTGLKDMDDQSLVRRVQEGDQEAFTELVDRWQNKIHRFAYGFLADADDAGEITQKTFIKAYQKLDTLDDRGKFSSWIYRVANNLCLDELKRAGRRKSTPLELWNGESVAGTINPKTPADTLETRELEQILRKALLTLSEEQRTVVILKEYEGLKFREIADILGEPENTVKSRLYYGLKHLRRTLTTWNIPKQYLNDD